MQVIFAMDSSLWGALAVLLIAVTMVFQAIRGVLIRKKVYLPAVIYLVTVAGLIPTYGFSDTLIAAICTSLMLFAFDVAVVKQHSNAPLFFVGATSIFAIFFVPKLIILLPLAFILLAQIGRFSLKDISAIFVGYLTSALFLYTGLSLFDAQVQVWNDWLAGLLTMNEVSIGSTTEWLRAACSLILLIVMIVGSVTKYMPQVYTARRSISVYISLLIVIAVTSILTGGISRDVQFISAIPVAWIAAYYYSATDSIGPKILVYSYLALSLFIG